MTPAAVKLELISEIQASLNAINGEESFGYNIQNIKEPTQVARAPLYKQVKPGFNRRTLIIRQVKH